MEEGIAVHTAARRYCLDRVAFWSRQYSEIVRNGRDRQSNGYTLEALSTFPRYNVLNAIRVELERIDPTELPDFETAKEYVILVGESANDVFTVEPNGEIQRVTMAEERASFCEYLRGITLADLSAIEPLPFRRVLTTSESEAFRARLRERWHLPADNWYPLVDCPLTNVVAFEATAFHEGATSERLQHILAKRGVESILELREFGPEYIQHVALFDPYYNGAEGFWSSEAVDWIVYASHESSVTVGGWLLDEVQASWPSWRDHLWLGVV